MKIFHIKSMDKSQKNTSSNILNSSDEVYKNLMDKIEQSTTFLNIYHMLCIGIEEILIKKEHTADFVKLSKDDDIRDNAIYWHSDQWNHDILIETCIEFRIHEYTGPKQAYSNISNFIKHIVNTTFLNILQKDFFIQDIDSCPYSSPLFNILKGLNKKNKEFKAKAI